VEIGELVVDGHWNRVDLSKPFTDPVVIAKAVSDRSATPAVVRIRQSDATGFEVRLQPLDERSQLPAPEAVGYLVIERGRFRLADGTSVESGTVDADPTYPVHSIAFSAPFRVAPVVMTALTNVQDSTTALTGRPTLVSKQDLQVHLRTQGTSHPIDSLQTVSYVAWEPSAGILDGLTFEVNTTQKVTRGQFSLLPFTALFTDAPVFLADIQSSQGGSPTTVRWDQKSPGGIEVKIDDEADLNADRVTPEDTDVVGYIVIK
jgi:hypothetical protein